MASTFTEEERNELIKQVYEYFKDTNESTRNIAKKFKISNYTVSSYLKIAKEIYKDKDIEIELINHKKTIENLDVKDRVIKVTNMYLDGMIISEIADSLNESYYTIYRDLTNRLPKIDIELAKKVSLIMKENKINNLNHVSIK